MTVEREVADHYAHGALIEAIEKALAASGIDRDAVTVADLAPVDEFHIGGRPATVDLAVQIALAPSDRVLDVGCGLGGAARFFADEVGCAVTGIDLTAEYVATARTLSGWVGLGERNTFEHASALAMPFGDASFDAAYMLHVGMNIEAKTELFTEIARVLAPGGKLGIFDIMRTNDGEVVYPVPWAETAETSYVASPEETREFLQGAGFEVLEIENRRDFALQFFHQRLAGVDGGGTPPLGLHLVMGETWREKFKNTLANTEAGRIAPVQMIARRTPA